jgi:hypothetical protein
VGNPAAVTTEEIPYGTLQTMADHEFPHGNRYYTKSGYFAQLDERVVDLMLTALLTIPSPMSQIELTYLGGAMARVGAGETAFGDRGAPFIVNILGNWKDAADDHANVAWVRKLFADLRPSMKPGVYVNFMSGDEEDRVPEAYRERWDRLVASQNGVRSEKLFPVESKHPAAQDRFLKTNARPSGSSGGDKAQVLFQLGVFRFGLLEDGNVGVGVLPESEEMV